jgi:hypothetical protein
MEGELMGLSCEGVGRKCVGCTSEVLKLGISTFLSENKLAAARIL